MPFSFNFLLMAPKYFNDLLKRLKFTEAYQFFLSFHVGFVRRKTCVKAIISHFINELYPSVFCFTNYWMVRGHNGFIMTTKMNSCCPICSSLRQVIQVNKRCSSWFQASTVVLLCFGFVLGRTG